jgi:hypothetical protein
MATIVLSYHGTIITAILALTILTGLPFIPASAEIILGNIQNISEVTSGAAFAPSVAASGNNVYVLWAEERHDGTYIVLRASHDSGISFGTPIILDINRFPLETQLSAVSNNVYAMWWSLYTHEIMFAASNDNGNTFGEPMTVGVGVEPNHPRLAAIGSDVYVAWSGFNADMGIYEVMLSSSHDSGTTFDDVVKLGEGRSLEIHMSISKSDVYVIWRAKGSDVYGDLFFVASHDSGATFSDPLDITLLNSNLELESFDASIAATAEDVYIAWTQGASEADIPQEVYFVMSNDKGTTFSEPMALSQNSQSRNVFIAVSQGHLFVTWFDAEKATTVFEVSSDGGKTFANMLDLGHGSPVQLAAAGDNVYVLMITDSSDKLFRASEDKGATFGDPFTVDDPPGSSSIPVFAVSESNNSLFVVWNDLSHGGEIFFRAGISTGERDSEPPDTKIVRATDSFSDSIINSGYTLSDSIRFKFRGIDDSGQIAGFECRLDNIARFGPCTSPTTFPELSYGKHTFRVRAIDAAGNVDPTPSVWRWDVLTPAQGVEKLINRVNALQGLENEGIRQSLLAQLNGIIENLNDGNEENDASVCNKLDAFISQVNIKLQNGQLTTEQAAKLEKLANQTMTILDCN